MGVTQWIYRPVKFDFPAGFPERVRGFKEARGLSLKAPDSAQLSSSGCKPRLQSC